MLVRCQRFLIASSIDAGTQVARANEAPHPSPEPGLRCLPPVEPISGGPAFPNRTSQGYGWREGKRRREEWTRGTKRFGRPGRRVVKETVEDKGHAG
jgi:hypothetical protein